MITKLPSSLTYVGDYAFGWSYLDVSKLPDTIQYIGKAAFCECGLTKGPLIIPPLITEISDFAFSGISISELIFHDRVTKIGNSAFSECYSLQSINFSDSITSIGDSAFADCPNLKNISLPNNLEHLGSGAFSGCSGVENDSVLLPYGAKSIGSGVFAGMPPLKAVGLPDTLTSIDPKLFYNGDEKSIPAKFVYCTLYNDSYVRSILGDEDGFCYLPYYWPVSYNGSPEKLLPPDLPIISDPTNPDDEWFLEGWYTDQAMTNRWDFENDAVTQDTMLYANWQNRFITRHITFTTNSENTLPAQIINSGLSLSEPQITKKGHTFLGWYADSEFQTPYDFSSPVRSDLHLYAKWKINDYTATFDSAGGPAAPSQTLPYGSLLTPPQDMIPVSYTHLSSQGKSIQRSFLPPYEQRGAMIFDAFYQ